MAEYTKEQCLSEMSLLFTRAESQGLWMHCAYQDMWFSPAELKAYMEQGRFCWGPVNWNLRDPREQITYLAKKAADARKEFVPADGAGGGAFDFPQSVAGPEIAAMKAARFICRTSRRHCLRRDRRQI